MNGIDKIIARMEADTQAECADIAAQAAAEAEAILARYRAEADKLLREGEARCKVLEHEQVERLEGGSRLACRQRVLAEKQRLLDEAFARAADALLKLPRPEYIDLLASLAAENGQGGEALVFSAADRDTVVSQPDDKGMSDVSLRYTDQEWKRLREAFSEVEELMVASSPRVWNRLKGVDKPRLDESRDEPVTIFAPRNQITALDDD